MREADRSGGLGSKPVVLLHAYPLHGGMWDPLVEALAGRKTLAPTYPGFGGQAPGPRTLEGFAEEVMRGLDRAAIEDAVFVGLSMGGYIAFRIWASAPERVAGLVLADTRAGPDSAAAAERRTAQAERARRDGIGWLPEEMLGAVLGESTRAKRPHVVERVRQMMLDADPEGVARALLAMRDRPDSRPLLGTIDVPTLVVVGEEDGLTGEDEARAIAAGVGGADLIVVPEAGHLSAVENPEAFNSAVIQFLQGRGRGARVQT